MLPFIPSNSAPLEGKQLQTPTEQTQFSDTLDICFDTMRNSSNQGLRLLHFLP